MNAETSFFLPDALIINVPAIDDQHAGLFARLAHLKDLCIESNCLPSVEADTLLECLSVHCATEEYMAAQVGLDFAEHAQKHQKMLKAIARTLHEVKEGRTDVFSLIRFIEYWFERHISEEDRPLGRNLQNSSPVVFANDFSDRMACFAVAQSA